MNKKQALEKAISLSPSLNAFAAALKLSSYKVVQQWRINGVPAKYCPSIERLTNRVVICEWLEPDVEWTYLRGSIDHPSIQKWLRIFFGRFKRLLSF